MDNDTFLKKFQNQFETIGRDGILGIMRSAHIEISKETTTENKNKKQSTSQQTQHIKLKSLQTQNDSLYQHKDPYKREQTNKEQINLHKTKAFNNIYQQPTTKTKHSNTLPKITRTTLPKQQHVKPQTKKINEKVIKKLLKVKTSNTNDILLKKIKQEDATIHSLTFKIQKLLEHDKKQKELELKKSNTHNIQHERSKQRCDTERRKSTLTSNKINLPPIYNNVTINNEHTSNNNNKARINNNNNNKNNYMRSLTESTIKDNECKIAYQPPQISLNNPLKTEFERLILQRRGYKYSLPNNSLFK